VLADQSVELQQIGLHDPVEVGDLGAAALVDLVDALPRTSLS